MANDTTQVAFSDGAKPGATPEPVPTTDRLQLNEHLDLMGRQMDAEKMKFDVNAVVAARLMETTKLLCDYFKHLATLGTGSILIIITLHEKIFTNHAPKWLLVPAILPFLISIVMALLAQQSLALMWVNQKTITDREKKTYVNSAAGSLMAFVIGLGIILWIVAFGAYSAALAPTNNSSQLSIMNGPS